MQTAGVLGMVTAPTYNLEDYKTDYESILNAENSPLVNRATDGLYRPGSTFKTITATAGLNEGIITGNSTYFCGHTYHSKTTITTVPVHMVTLQLHRHFGYPATSSSTSCRRN